MRELARQERAYNAGYRPPELPPREPFTLGEGELRIGPFGQVAGYNPRPEPQITPFQRETLDQGAAQAEAARTSREKIASEGREPKKVSDLQRRYVESQIAKNVSTETKVGTTPFAAAKALETLSPEKYAMWLRDYIQKQIEPPGTTPHPSTQVAKLDAMINDPYADRTPAELEVLNDMKDEYLKLWQGSLVDGIGIEDIINKTKVPTNIDELNLQIQEMYNAGIEEEDARKYYNRMKVMLSGNQ